MINFKTGDIVQLKSGGPKMTVDQEDVMGKLARGDAKVHCQWFAGNKLESGWFPADSLIKVGEEEKRKK